jgi:hypothetical protein
LEGRASQANLGALRCGRRARYDDNLRVGAERYALVVSTRKICLLPQADGALMKRGAPRHLAGFKQLHRPAISLDGWRGRNTAAQEVYDPASNRWTALANGARPLGGRRARRRPLRRGRPYRRQLFAHMRRMLPQPIPGSSAHRCPMARSGIAAAVLEGRMFVFGGEAPACGMIRKYEKKILKVKSYSGS